MKVLIARGAVFALVAAAALAPGAAAPAGFGWSRAPDLSVYGAMRVYARNAVEQKVLCEGQTPERAALGWAREYSARQDWVDAAMARRYGADFMARVRTPFTPRVACPSVHDPRWRDQYGRLLRLLEIRFGPVPEREG